MAVFMMTLMGLATGLGLYFVVPLAIFLVVLTSAPMVLLLAGAELWRRITGKLAPALTASALEGEVWTLEATNADRPALPPDPTISATWPADEASADEQIRELYARSLPEILEQLPSDGSHTALFHQSGGDWNFQFKFVSLNARFAASGTAATPKEAYRNALHALNRQIRDWRATRELGRIYVPTPAQHVGPHTLSHAPKAAAAHPRKSPKVLIVDDDVDVAKVLESVFRQFGCETEIATHVEDMHRLMSFEHCDFIILDWMLDEKTRGSHVIERAVRIIDAFADLQARFERRHPKIVTYSAFDRSRIQLPDSKYFDHTDHWQKPIQFSELSARASELLGSAAVAA